MEANGDPFKLILGSSSVARRKILTDMGYVFKVESADIDEKCIRKDKPEDLVMALAEAKADAICSKLQSNGNLEEAEPTILITTDTAEDTVPLGNSMIKLLIKKHSKAEAISQKSSVEDCMQDAEPTLLITCDQVVVYDGVVREKPSNEEEAREFLRGYSGKQAATVSSVLVTNLKTGIRKGEVDRVEVNFRNQSWWKSEFVDILLHALDLNIHFHEIPNEVVEMLIKEGTVLSVAGGLIIEHPLLLPCVKQVVGTTDSVMGLPIAPMQKLIKDVLQLR